MFIEFRRYIFKNNYMDDWIKVMENKIFPFIATKGMMVLGSFRSEFDKGQYIWLRSFPDDVIRVKQYKAVYESEFWGKEIIPNADKMLEWEGIKVVRFVSDNAALPYTHDRYEINTDFFIEFRRFRAKPGGGKQLADFVHSIWIPYLQKQNIINMDFFTLPEFDGEYVLMVKYKDADLQKIGMQLEEKSLFTQELDTLLQDTYLEAPLLKTTDTSKF